MAVRVLLTIKETAWLLQLELRGCMESGLAALDRQSAPVRPGGADTRKKKRGMGDVQSRADRDRESADRK